MPSRARRLERLRARIVGELYLKEWREVWFFPALNGVKGWRGTQDIMFVALNPSTGQFPSRADRLLYAQLRRGRFARAHLTDVVKERLPGPKIRDRLDDPKSVKHHRRYLLEEIQIIRPKLVVAMGSQAHQLLARWLPPGVRLRRIPFYAPRFLSAGRRRQFVKQFGRELARIRAEYESKLGSSGRHPRTGRMGWNSRRRWQVAPFPTISSRGEAGKPPGEGSKMAAPQRNTTIARVTRAVRNVPAAMKNEMRFDRGSIEKCCMITAVLIVFT